MTGGFGEKAKAKNLAKKTLAAAGRRMKKVANHGVIVFTSAEMEILREALDSHIYFQLSDQKYRKDGFVYPPGSDDPELAEAIQEADALLIKLGGQSMLDGDGAQ